MPVPPGSALDPDATRARILTVAGRLFYERGIHAVGIAEIAETAEASKLTIYRNFGSKDGLVEAVLRDRSARVRAWMRRGIADVAPGRDQVLALFDLLAEWYREEGFRGCAMVNAATDDRGADGAAGELARHHLRFYREKFERCLRDAGASDPARAARELLIIVEGATVVNAVDPGYRGGTDAHRLAELVLDAALTPSGAPAR